MRVLILSALFACAASAPSHLGLPVLAPIVAIGTPITVPAGDVQAAVINAQVRLTDEARAIADQSRELQEQVIENRNEGVIEANDLAKEKSEELFWSAEEKKWQALEAAQTAAAALDGSLSSNADNIAKSAIVGNVAEVVSAPVEVVAAQEVEAKSAVKPEETEVKLESKAAEVKEGPKEEVAKDAVKSVVHPIPLGVAPFSYQAINPVGYAQIGLRTVPFPIPVSPYYNPHVFNTIF